jgi:phage terminase large subunit-like protein
MIKRVELENDWQMALLLRPDEWEMDFDYIATHPNVVKKVNSHLGVTVQPAFYEQKIIESKMDAEARKETMTKLFNVFLSERITEWVKPDQIVALQTDTTIDDLSSDDGWQVYTGFDFSMGDDIYAVSYLAVRWDDEREQAEFFADMNAWVSEEGMKESPLRALYEKWRDDGWLNVVPGWTFPTSLFLNRVAELGEHLLLVAFGYDPYRATQPVNDLSAYVFSEGSDPKQTVIPVRQNFANYNPLVLEMDYMLKNDPPLIHFSRSPLWPWQFGNCRVCESTDGMENKKIQKATDASKIDNVQALMNALYCYDVIQGKVQ